MSSVGSQVANNKPVVAWTGDDWMYSLDPRRPHVAASIVAMVENFLSDSGLIELSPIARGTLCDRARGIDVPFLLESTRFNGGRTLTLVCTPDPKLKSVRIEVEFYTIIPKDHAQLRPFERAMNQKLGHQALRSEAKSKPQGFKNHRVRMAAHTSP